VGLTALLAVAVFAGAAHAELFRCKGPDGKTIFTDQKKVCPGADPSEPAGVVHRAETAAPPDAASVPAARERDTRAEVEEAAKAQWKQKKLDVERHLAEIRTRRDAMEKFVSHCNRPGRYVTTRDDAGIQQVVNCSDLKRQFDDLDTQEAAARNYLATGLAEECRRAGCLPGWLR
jgi:hypothetical protein